MFGYVTIVNVSNDPGHASFLNEKIVLRVLALRLYICELFRDISVKTYKHTKNKFNHRDVSQIISDLNQNQPDMWE